jgi:hypothetical protein
MFRFLKIWQKIKKGELFLNQNKSFIRLKSIHLIFLKFLSRKKSYEHAVQKETEQQQGPNHYADILQRKDTNMLISSVSVEGICI